MLILWLFEMVNDWDNLTCIWPGIILYAFFFISFAVVATYLSEERPNKKEAKKEEKKEVVILVEFKNSKPQKSLKVLDFGFENIELREDILFFLYKYMKEDKIITIDHEVYLGSKKNTLIVKDRVQYYLNEQLHVDAIIRLN